MRHGETMRVCATCGSRDVRIRAWVDCNSRSTESECSTDGDGAGAWCPTCQAHSARLVDAPYCEDCDGKGWDVFDCGGVLEVQRCDACKRLDTDDTAVEVAFGAGLTVSLASGEVEEDDADAWRDRYRPLRTQS